MSGEGVLADCRFKTNRFFLQNQLQTHPHLTLLDEAKPEEVDWKRVVSSGLGSLLGLLAAALLGTVAYYKHKALSQNEGFKYVRRKQLCTCCKKKVKIGKVVMFQQDLEDVKEILELSKQQAHDRTLEHLKQTAKIDCNDSFFGMDEYKKN